MYCLSIFVDIFNIAILTSYKALAFPILTSVFVTILTNALSVFGAGNKSGLYVNTPPL